MKHAAMILGIALAACGGPATGTDAGPRDSGPSDAGPRDSGPSDAGSDAGPSPVTIEHVTTDVHANCQDPGTNTFVFTIVVRYSTDDDTMDYTYNVVSATAQLDQAPMTLLDMTVTPASGPINFVGPDGGTPSLVRHSLVDYTPVLTDPCSLCGTDKTVTWEFQVSAAGRVTTLGGNDPFRCSML